MNENELKDKNYYVLIADLKDSKKYDANKRCVIQDILIKAIDFINYQMEKAWMSNSLSGKYKLQCGLEFSGGVSVMCMSSSLETLCECVKLLKLVLNAVPARFAIGKGGWTVMTPMKGINFQDGSAFWHAKRAMEFCHAVNDDVCIPCDCDAEQELRSQLKQIEKCSSDMELEELFPKIIDANLVEGMKGYDLPFKYRGEKKESDMRRLVLYNDSTTSRLFVTCIVSLATDKTFKESEGFIAEVEKKGFGTIGCYPKHVAEDKRDTILKMAKDHPTCENISVTVEE